MDFVDVVRTLRTILYEVSRLRFERECNENDVLVTDIVHDLIRTSSSSSYYVLLRSGDRTLVFHIVLLNIFSSLFACNPTSTVVRSP